MARRYYLILGMVTAALLFSAVEGTWVWANTEHIGEGGTRASAYDVAVKELIVDPPGIGLYYAPNEVVDVNVNIQNNGPGTQNVTLYLNLTDENGGSVLNSQSKSIDLPPTNDYFVGFEITTPGTEGNYTIVAHLTPVSPPTDANYTNNSMSHPIQVRLVYEVAVTVDSPTEDSIYSVGEEINITFNIYNAGTADMSVDYFISLYNDDKGVEVFNHTDTIPNLQHGDGMPVTYSYTPTEADKGNLTLRIGAPIAGDSTPDNNIAELHLFVGVVNNLIMTLLSSDSAEAHAGDILHYNIQLYNGGNSDVSIGFRLSSPCEDWEVSVDGADSVTLAEGETKTVDVAVVVPSDANATMYYLEIIGYVVSNPNVYSYAYISINVLPSVRAFITSPRDGERFYRGESVYFDGSASYSPDPNVHVTSYLWTSSIDGQLSTQPVFNTTELSTGTHLITLKIEGDDGTSGVARVSIVVGEIKEFVSSDGHVTVLIPYFGTGSVYILPAQDPGNSTEGLVYTYTITTDIPDEDWSWAKISFVYDDTDIAGVNESTLKLWYWADEDERLQLCMNNDLDTVNNRVTTNVTELGTFALIGEKIDTGQEVKEVVIKNIYLKQEGKVTVGEPIEVSTYVADGQKPYTYHWDFGDGTQGTDITSYEPTVNATHTYTKTGIYTIKLTVEDSSVPMSFDMMTVDITVVNSPPKVIVSINDNPPTKYLEGDTIVLELGKNYNFSVEDSYDPDGHEITLAEWDMDEDNGTISGIRVSYSFSVVGEHNIKVTITDKYNASTQDTITVTVEEPASNVEEPGGDGSGVSSTSTSAGFTMLWSLVAVLIIAVVVIVLIFLLRGRRYREWSEEEWEGEEDWGEDEEEEW